MATRAMIDEFLSHHELALVRSSPSSPIRGARIDEELGKKGYKIAVVYLDDSVPEPRLTNLKDPVEGVIVAVPPNQCEKAVREAIEANIPRVWLQNGCESKSAIELCEQRGVSAVHGACVLMYAEPVKSIHAFHRWLWKTLGRLAK
jgi:predicted CoA-binding protein